MPTSYCEHNITCLSGYKVAGVVNWNECPASKVSYKKFSFIGYMFFSSAKSSGKYKNFKLSFVVKDNQNLDSEA